MLRPASMWRDRRHALPHHARNVVVDIAAADFKRPRTTAVGDWSAIRADHFDPDACSKAATSAKIVAGSGNSTLAKKSREERHVEMENAGDHSAGRDVGRC